MIKEGEIQMETNELPEIQVSYKKLFISASPNLIKHKIRCNAGEFFPDENIIILSCGDFTKSLLKKYNRTIIKQTCNTITHELVHWWVLNEINLRACIGFDKIAENLHNYGVY